MKMFYLQGSLENVWLTIPLVLSQIFLPFKVGQASFALKLPVFLLSPSGRVALGVPHAGLGVHHHVVVGCPQSHAPCCVQGTRV